MWRGHVYLLHVGDAPVRKEALKGLAKLGGRKELEGLVELLNADLGKATDRKPYELAAIAIAGRVGAKSRFFMDAQGKANPSGRASLIRILGRLGEEEALASVSAAANNKDATVRDAGVRALAEWPSTKPMTDSNQNCNYKNITTLVRLVILIRKRGVDGHTHWSIG